MQSASSRSICLHSIRRCGIFPARPLPLSHRIDGQSVRSFHPSRFRAATDNDRSHLAVRLARSAGGVRPVGHRHGLVGGLLAAVFGFLDWLSIRENTRAKSVGGWHGLGNLVIVLLFTTSWWLRTNDPGNVPSSLAFLLSLLGFGLALVTGWLGGELVYRLGMAVDEGAHENAPNALTYEQPSESSPARRKQTGGRSGD